MIFKYPYTDMYALNLDWIIQAIKEMQETIGPLDRIVNSVNGMTGDVEITKALITQILGNLVETFNGRTGDVELTAEDVNNTLIDITWTSDPGDTIDDLSQSELDEMYQSGKRVLIFVNNLGVADQVYFLQYYEGHAQPQEYSPTAALAGVASFNGQTGNVTVTGDDLETSGTDTRTIAESLEDLEETKVPVTRTVNNKPLTTNISINATDIPSQAITAAPTVEMALDNLDASKVPNARTVNNKSLINSITLNDEDIPSQVVQGETTVEGVLTDLDTRVSSQSRQIDEKTDQTNIAPVENGTTATQNYNVDDLIIIDGVLYKVTTPILSGETFVTGTNIIQTNIDSVISTFGLESIGFSVLSSDTLLSGGIFKVGKIVIVNFTMKSSRTVSNSPGIVLITLTAMRPKFDSALSAIDITSGISSSIDSAIPCGIQAGGRIFIKSLTTDHIYAITGVYVID